LVALRKKDAEIRILGKYFRESTHFVQHRSTQEQTLAAERHPLGEPEDEWEVLPEPERRVDEQKLAKDRSSLPQHGRLNRVVMLLVHQKRRALDLRGLDVVAGVIERADVTVRALDRQVERVRLQALAAVTHDDR